MTAVIAFSIAAAVTFLLRSSMTWAGGAVASPRVAAWIALVTPAVLTAMVASALVLDHGVVHRPGVADATAVVVAIVAVRRTGNVSTALLVGLPVYWSASMLIP